MVLLLCFDMQGLDPEMYFVFGEILYSTTILRCTLPHNSALIFFDEERIQRIYLFCLAGFREIYQNNKTQKYYMNPGNRENEQEKFSTKVRGADYTDVHREMILHAHNELGWLSKDLDH